VISTVDPKVLDKIGALQIRAKTLADGVLAGLHRSPHQGGSVEFSEYSEYVPGHEIKRVDWKVYAKSDKLYVKNFEDETNLRVYLVVDGSGSMRFESEEALMTKLRYHQVLSATLAHLFLRQGDSVGLISVTDDEVAFLSASSRSNHLGNICHAIEALEGRGRFGLTRALQAVADRAKPRSMVLLFSDFLEVDDDLFAELAVLSQRGYELAAFHLLDPAELSLPYEGTTLFEGLEGEGELLMEPDELRTRYQAVMRAHLDRVERGVTAANVGYQRLLSSTPVDEVILTFLAGRL
jgi:uncharacterized protein (DUF58 family)